MKEEEGSQQCLLTLPPNQSNQWSRAAADNGSPSHRQAEAKYKRNPKKPRGHPTKVLDDREDI